MINYEPSSAFACLMDQNDCLSRYRESFLVPDPHLIYLDGNSLGRPTAASIECVNRLTDEWSNELIRSYNLHWWDAPRQVGAILSPLVGSDKDQVIVCDTVSINLYKLVYAALSLNDRRKKIVTDTMNFPSDLYVLQGLKQILGKHHCIVCIGSLDGIAPDLDELFKTIDKNTALVTLSHVTFKSGYLYDMMSITDYAHAQGALVLWDLSHSVGALPVALDDCGVDFAVGCTYKYLNGGPGSPAFLYVKKDLQEKVISPIWAWWGHKEPFSFQMEYKPASGIARFLSGSQPIISMMALEASLPVLLDAGMNRIREKSISLGSYLIYLTEKHLFPLGFMLGSPRASEQRGSHVSIRHPDGYRISRALIEEMGVIPDFREPDNIRLGLAPLYTTYSDIWQAVERISHVVSEGIYRKYPNQRLTVT